MSLFHDLVAKKQWEKSKKLWFHPPWVFYFGFFIEFLIELLKKIETLLFFEIELVCGFELFCALFCSWVDIRQISNLYLELCILFLFLFFFFLNDYGCGIWLIWWDLDVNFRFMSFMFLVSEHILVS